MVPTHQVVREIANGVWLIVTLELVVFFLLYFWSRVWRAYTGSDLRLFLATEPDHHPFWLPKWYDSSLQFASGVLCLAVGGLFRASWVYPFMRCQNEMGGLGCDLTEATWWVLWVATALSIAGGVCLIRIVSPPQWRVAAVTTCTAIPIIVPTLIYLIF